MAGPVPYRSPSALPEEPPDPEALAYMEIARRAKRIRLAVMLPLIVGGIALGVVAYLGLREMFFDTLGAHSPYLTGLATILPAVTLAWKMASWLARALIARRTNAWIAELAGRHDLAPEPLAEFAKAL